MENVTIVLAFLGGFLAFISPCCLPLYPTFLSYITGASVSQLKENSQKSLRRQVMLHSVFFSIGFASIYYILGFSISSVGQVFVNNQQVVRLFGGLFLVFMGLFLMGVIKPQWLFKEKRLQFRSKKVSYLNSTIVGVVFSAGWTPCIGPIFATIMYSSLVNPGQTFVLVTAYSLGFCLPFILMAFVLGKTRVILRYSNALMKVGGFIIVVIGVMVYFDMMIYLNIWTAEVQYRIYDVFGIEPS